MTVALITAGLSFLLFVTLAWISTLEMRANKRFFLSYLRNAADHLIHDLAIKVHSFFVYLGKYVITLSWYYSLHTLLRLLLKFLAGTYYMLENILHRNRDKARKIRQEKKNKTKSHLEVIADHRASNQLTVQQKKKLKDKSISGN